MSAHLQTTAHNLNSEFFELGNVDRNFPLKIAHANFGNDGDTQGHLAIWRLLVIPSAKVSGVEESLISHSERRLDTARHNKCEITDVFTPAVSVLPENCA